MEQERPLILFDGVCNLCDAFVRFVLPRDRADVFRFAPLQSRAGEGNLSTIVLVEPDGRRHQKSSAILRVLRKLSWPWPLLYPLILVPPSLRDAAYDFVARNRYRWFGKKDVCGLPAAADRRKFLS